MVMCPFLRCRNPVASMFIFTQILKYTCVFINNIELEGCQDPISCIFVSKQV